jgi:hypothetical protein
MAKRETCDFKIEAGSELTLCALDKNHKGDHSPVRSAERVEEFHVTVDGVNPIDWFNFCSDHEVKPLHIELNTMGLQLMCALGEDPEVLIKKLTTYEWPGAETVRVVRVKHEVNPMTANERPVYYECHVKLEGPMLGNIPMSSRDLYRGNRWYLTKRSANPFSAEDFYRGVVKRMDNRSNQKVLGFEYEVCVQDSNPSLDSGWAR